MKRRAPALIAAFVVAAGVGVLAATLKAESIGAWTTYVAATEKRMAAELSSPDRFLSMAFGRDAAADRKAVLGGAIVIRALETRDDKGGEIPTPSAMIHHWIGEVFIPGESVGEVYAWVKSGAADTGQEDVLHTAVLERGEGSLRMSLKLRRTKIITAIFNTEHLVTFRQISPTRAVSNSVATRIAEIADYGTPKEHELPQGEDRGFLWRWNAYWRYEQVPGGVIAECESISLSRELPPVVGLMIRPIVSGAARESMERTLAALRTRLAKPGAI